MERLDRAKCLQEEIGSCAGCQIQEIAINRIRMASEEERPKITKRINDNLCPEGVIMQMPTIRRSSLMW